MQGTRDIEHRVELASSGYTLSIENLLQVGFNQFRKAPGLFLVYGLITAVCLSNPVSGLLLGGPLFTGYFVAVHGLEKRGSVRLEEFFRSFDKFPQLLALQLVLALLIFLGFLLLIVPGIYFSVSFMFAHIFVWFFDLPLSDALRISRKLVSGNFIQLFWLWLILTGINLLGAMALGIGLVATLPFSFCVIYAAFDDMIGIP